MKHFGVLALLSALFVGCSSTEEISTDDLRAPFVEHKTEIDNCYLKVMRKQPDIGEGTAEFKFMINEEGKAAKTIFMKKRSTLSNKLLNACIKKAVHSWNFPSGKAVDVVYPFTFEKPASSLGSESTAAKPAAKAAAKPAAAAAAPAAKKAEKDVDEPKKNSELDVIDTSPPEEDADSGDEESTPVE